MAAPTLIEPNPATYVQLAGHEAAVPGVNTEQLTAVVFSVGVRQIEQIGDLVRREILDTQ